MGARFSAPGPDSHPASYAMSIGSFPGLKRARAWHWPPTPSSSEVKKRIQLYPYSNSRPSWSLRMKRRMLCLNTPSVPRRKHFISVIKTDQFMLYGAESSCLFWDKYRTYKHVNCGQNIQLLNVKLWKPTGYVTHQQFNIQQLYVLCTLHLCVLCLSENKQRLVPLTA
jgi:hypothetical protein